MEKGVGSEGLARIKNKQLSLLPEHLSVPSCTNNPSLASRGSTDPAAACGWPEG